MDLGMDTIYPPLEYHELDFGKFEFRLLTLLDYEFIPGTVGSSEPILQCSLKHEYLDEPPPYKALSYCWGDNSIPRKICINHQWVQITANLEAALRQLKAHKITTLWIDALCINQNDVDERGLQVQRMGLIYKQATSVVIWLGAEADNSKIAMDQLRQGRGFNLHENESNPLWSFFRRPFWCRVWIIQEVCKARALTVLCGDQTIAWDRLERSFPNIASLLPPQIESLQVFRNRENGKMSGWIPRELRGRSNRARGRGLTPEGYKGRLTLLDALVRSKHCLCTDDRDRVYALLGVCSDGPDIVPAPSYRHPANEVFFRVFKKILRGYGWGYLVRETTTTLSPASRKPNWANLREGLPAWITEIIWQPLYSWQHFYPDGYPVSLPLGRDLKRVRDYGPIISEAGLRGSVCILDTIEGLSSNLSGQPGLDDLDHDFTSSEAATGDPNPPPSFILAAIWKTLLVPRMRTWHEFAVSFHSERISYALSRVFVDSGWSPRHPQLGRQMDLVVKWLYENSKMVLFGHTLRQWFELYLNTDGYRKEKRGEGPVTKRLWDRVVDGKSRLPPFQHDQATFVEAVSTAAEGHVRLAVTKKSSIALVPLRTRRHDVVAKVRYSRSLVVLRPAGTSFLYIGEALHYSWHNSYDRERAFEDWYEEKVWSRNKIGDEVDRGQWDEVHIC